MQDIKSRLLSKVVRDPITKCWNFTGAIINAGYGVLKVSKKVLLAHRISYEIHKKPIPKGLWVLHHCDNRRCINPKHLFLGTRSDNMIDCSQKNRLPGRKLTIKQVQEIRNAVKLGNKKYILAELYNVTCSTIHSIIIGKSYKWIK